MWTLNICNKNLLGGLGVNQLNIAMETAIMVVSIVCCYTLLNLVSMVT